MNLYKENKKFLEEQLPYIQIKQQSDSRFKAVWEESASQETILAVQKETEKIYLNSRYEAELWAKQWVEQFENVNYRTKFFLLGIGNGMFLQALHNKYPENIIICCEIYDELEKAELEQLNFIELLTDNVYLIMGKDKIPIYRSYISNMITYSDYNKIVFCSIPNYERIDKETFEIYHNMYVNSINDLFYCRNTLIADEAYRRESFLNNLFIFPRNYELGQLVEKMESIDISDRAAIVVSAGPSLDKNINELKNAKGKALLIAVDAAAKPMVKAGVYPDIIVTIDPVKDESILQEGRLLEYPLVASIYSHYKITRQQKGPVYFPTSENDYIGSVYQKYGYGKIGVSSGGSVANNAFSLAVMFGFKTIILVGQDLGYPGGKVHANQAVYKNCLDNSINVDNTDKYFEVEANDGGKILTEANMNAYRKWFEEQAAKGEVKIVNATEGGAKINGTKCMTLKKALEVTCNNKEYVNFEDMMRVENKAFTVEQRNEIYMDYKNANENLAIWLKRLKKGIQAYEKLDMLNRKGKYNTNVYKHLIEEIGDLTKKFETSDTAAMLNQWMNKTEYEVLDSLAESESSLYDEVKTIIDGGIKMYKSYIDSSVALKKKWNELLITYNLN